MMGVRVPPIPPHQLHCRVKLRCLVMLHGLRTYLAARSAQAMMKAPIFESS